MRKIIDKGLELSLIFLMAFLVVDVFTGCPARGTAGYLSTDRISAESI